MNIRDPHSKFGIRPETRFTRDDYAVHLPPAVSEDDADSRPAATAPSGAALQALATTDPAQFAGIMSAIAGELRAAADNARGPQSGFLDALATQFESAAKSTPPVDATADAAALTLPPEGALPELPTLPLAQQGHHGHLSHHGLSANRHGEQLLERILDAVNAALTQVT